MAVYRLPVNLQWIGPGSPGANIWHFRTQSTVDDSAEVSGAVSAIRAFYFSLAGVNILAPNLFMSATEAVDVESQEVKSVDFATINTGTAGTDAPEVLQICIGWRTSIAARRGRGRTFLGPLNGSALESNGSIAEAAVTAVTNSAEALVEASDSANGWGVGVYGLQTSGTGPNGPKVLRDFTGARVRDRFAVLRSRRD